MIKEANYVDLNNFQKQRNSFITVSMSPLRWSAISKIMRNPRWAIHKGTKCMTTIPMALVGCSLDGFMIRESKSLAGLGRIRFLV